MIVIYNYSYRSWKLKISFLIDKEQNGKLCIKIELIVLNLSVVVYWLHSKSIICIIFKMTESNSQHLFDDCFPASLEQPSE